MKDRIRQIMESQHMTQQTFSQLIDVSPASLSSIFNGRTKPTLNIVEAITTKIPNISLEWLMNGNGEMYSTGGQPMDMYSRNDNNTLQNSLSANTNEKQLSNSQELPFSFDSLANLNNSINIGNKQSTTSNSTRTDVNAVSVKYIEKPQRAITEIRIFYDDQTWETFVPKK